MVQVLEGVSPLASLVGGFGKGAISGVNQGLQNLSQKRKEKQENETLRNLIGKDVSGLSPEIKRDLVREFVGMQAAKEQQQSIISSLVEQGVPEKDAELYAKFTTGGQTQFAKDILESRKRGGQFSGKALKPFKKLEGDKEVQEEHIEQPRELSPEEEVHQELEEIVQKSDSGLTPSERVKRGSERYKENYPVYKEASEKLRSLSQDKERLGILKNLNESKKLPKNLARINVDKEGNLRLPFAASPEAQRYVKTLNEFSSGAKDTFGSRVTNFDLAQYLKRFPTLLNSEEGRKQLIQQMKIVNDINSIYYKNLKNVYETAGGVRKIDADQAGMLAERLSEPKVKEMVEKFGRIGSFETKPSASEFKGATIRDKETGELMRSDGNDWIPVE